MNDQNSNFNQAHILILGIGNLLWADEGFGVRLVNLLHQRYVFPWHVTLMDGGTQGMYLLPHIQIASHLLILDAIDYGLDPGTLKIVKNADVPQFMGVKKMSLHQTGFQEVLAAAVLTGKCPQHLALIGIQPELLEDYGGSLTFTVKAQMDNAITACLHLLAEWGVIPEKRTLPLAESEGLTDPSLGLEAYETQRPDAEYACRWGDARVLNQIFPKTDA
ncbi:HyaD/HybD family hydrogenase maturation endopeptidase [Thioflexithrix psekupsensis]|uniref:Hydrogenase expression/formation protein n=1 Tax=Thioflexithrix psekupsensis TaxID=1570016 RepID=A0A251X8T5_9GAMM|nr:HyaD/HybD family hydrogenase maturation endopeptidase [Thioflexithrix psekupsensis]OUD14345.1 hydrogenase expression/formation protein [Thioflexithrix psekupsensis]